MSQYTKPFDEKMDLCLNHLERELAAIRAGRANPAVLDRITVDYYGAPTPINQVAAITVPEARVITITPWDTSLVHLIEKSLLTSDLGINPANDGRVIRLVFPAPTEERRKQLTKDVKKLGEETKTAVRNVRRDAIDKFKALKKASEITEDDQKNLEDEIQKITDKKTQAIDKICEEKNREIMEI